MTSINSAAAMSATSFVNQNWSEGSSSVLNQYPSAGIEVTLYTNDSYNTYVTFLASTEASNKVDEDTAYLTQSYLNNFGTQISSYDSYTMRVKLTFDDPLTVNNQAMAFCIA